MIKIDGDVIYFEGFFVAVILPLIGATERARFVEALERVTDVEKLNNRIAELEKQLEKFENGE